MSIVPKDISYIGNVRWVGKGAQHLTSPDFGESFVNTGFWVEIAGRIRVGKTSDPKAGFRPVNAAHCESMNAALSIARQRFSSMAGIPTPASTRKNTHFLRDCPSSSSDVSRPKAAPDQQNPSIM